MATEIALPDQKTDEEVKDKVDEERKAVEQETVSSSKKNIEMDEEQNPKSVEVSGSVIKSEVKTEDKQFDLPAVVEGEKVYDTPGLHVPEVDVLTVAEAPDLKPDFSSVSNSAVEDVENEPEGQSAVSDTPESTVEAGEKLVEHLEVPVTQETGHEEGKNPKDPDSGSKIIEKLELTVKEPQLGKESQFSELESKAIEKPELAGEQPEVEKEAEESMKTNLAVEGKPQEQTGVLEEVEKKSRLEVEEKPQERTGALEEVEKKSSLEVEEQPQEQTGAVEEVEKRALEVEEKPQELAGVLEEVEKKQALEVEEKPQEQTGVVEGVVEKKLTSNEEETLQEQIEVLEEEAEKKLASEGEDTPQEQTGVLEDLEQKPTLEMETKPQQTGNLEEVEKKSETPEFKESTDAEVAKGEGILVDKIEEVSESLEEEQTGNSDETAVSKKLDAGVSMNQEAPSDANDGIPSIVTDVEEKASLDDTEKEQSGADVEEGLPKEEAVEVGKVEEEKNASKSETQNSVDVNDFSYATEASKESFEGERASEDAAVVVEENKEDGIKGGIEITIGSDIEVKVDPVHATDTTKEPDEEPKELEPKDFVEPVEDKLNKVAEPVEETLKSDASNFEPAKDANYSKTDGVMPKQEAPTKPAQKQTNNIISKVKHSIVKVKKAFIGKSPSSKTITTDAKRDLNVK